MHLRCPSCQADIHADDVNLNRLVAKCRACHAVFGFVPEGAAPIARARPEVPMPKRIEVVQEGSSMTLKRRWLSPMFGFLVFFCCLWDGFLVAWYAITFATGAGLIFELFPLIHVSVGLGLTYYTICGFVNSTTITADYEALKVRVGPLPWPGRRDVPRLDLDQLYVVEKISQGKNGTSSSYELHARLRSGTKLKLVAGFVDPDQALYIEQTLERFLGIKDAPVPGELARA